jgi:hypothetical protein
MSLLPLTGASTLKPSVSTIDSLFLVFVVSSPFGFSAFSMVAVNKK